MPPVDALPQTNASKETIRSDENLSRDLHHPKIKGERLQKDRVYKLMRVEGRASNVLGDGAGAEPALRREMYAGSCLSSRITDVTDRCWSLR